MTVGNGTILLPPEVCKIQPGQRRTKLSDKQTAEMIKTAAQNPSVRANKIQNVVVGQAGFPNGARSGLVLDTMFGLQALISPKSAQARCDAVAPQTRLSTRLGSRWTLA